MVEDNKNLRKQFFQLTENLNIPINISASPWKIPSFMGPPVFVSSDNAGSAKQISDHILFSDGTYIFPKGCHIQLNPSPECFLETSVYWVLLAMSDYLVTQTDGGAPISAYSRYAGMYGLKKDSLRDAKNCSRVIPRTVMSRIHQGNWFCR